jgi:hypothetical protein
MTTNTTRSYQADGLFSRQCTPVRARLSLWSGDRKSASLRTACETSPSDTPLLGVMDGGRANLHAKEMRCCDSATD